MNNRTYSTLKNDLATLYIGDHQQTSISDVYLISSPNNENDIYTSKKITFSLFANRTILNIQKVLNFSTLGTWKFRNNITINTYSIKDTIKQCVINLEYANKLFYDLLNKLIETIYKKRMPSYIGQIVISTTTKSESNLQKIFGENTFWKQIECRFLMAYNSSFNVIGGRFGEVKHTFTATEIPRHIHNFIPDTNGKSYNFSATWTPCKTNSTANPTANNSGSSGSNEDGSSMEIGVRHDKYQSRGCKEKTTSKETDSLSPRPAGGSSGGEGHGGGNAGNDRFTGYHPVGEARAIGIDCELTEHTDIYGNRGATASILVPKKSKNTPHNNIPPFYSVYVWRRYK